MPPDHDGAHHRRGWRIRTKLVLTLFLLQALLVSAVFVILVRNHDSSLKSELRSKERLLRSALVRKGESLTHNTSMAINDALATNELAFILQLVNTTVKGDPEVAYCHLVTPDGRAMVSTQGALMGQRMDLPEDRAALGVEKTTVRNVKSRPIQGAIGPYIEVVEPFRAGGRRYVLRLGLSTRMLQRDLRLTKARSAKQFASTLRTSLAILAGSLLLAALLGWLMGNRFGRPIGKLSAAVRQFGHEGELEAKLVEINSTDEIGELSQSFNQMQSELRARHAEIQQHVKDLAAALAQAREANRLKSEFMANTSHELRTPLNAIINLPEGLLEQIISVNAWICESCASEFEPEEGDPKEGRTDCPECGGTQTVALGEALQLGADLSTFSSALTRVCGSGRHLLRVIDDILDFEKLEARRTTLKVEELSLAPMVTESVDTVGVMATQKGITLHAPELDGDWTLRADRVKVMQILMNLLSNAVKFTPAGGEVTLTIARTGGGLLFGVTDNGIGIPADQLDVIFDHFRQVDGSHTREHGGTGLGLAITRHLVRLHGGWIKVDSVLGKGSTFRFFLPADPKPLKANAAAELTVGDAGITADVDQDDVGLELLAQPPRPVERGPRVGKIQG